MNQKYPSPKEQGDCRPHPRPKEAGMAVSLGFLAILLAGEALVYFPCQICRSVNPTASPKECCESFKQVNKPVNLTP